MFSTPAAVEQTLEQSVVIPIKLERSKCIFPIQYRLFVQINTLDRRTFSVKKLGMLSRKAPTVIALVNINGQAREL